MKAAAASALRLTAALLFVVSLAGSWSSLLVSARQIDAERMALERRYTTPHSLGEDYVFHPRDGWETVNMTNLLYKYNTRSLSDDDVDGDDDADHDEHAISNGYSHGAGSGSGSGNHTLVKRAQKPKPNHTKPKIKVTSASKLKDKKNTKAAKTKSNAKAISPKKADKSTSSATDLIKGGLGKVMDSFKAIGKPEPVTITWYTGHDLLNPSCWSNPSWAPTDESFAAALTLEGWTTKPKCFKFLELCNSPQKCVFVRVVDSCAGCAQGSKHVDLTKAAFTKLADLDQGILTVQMRQASDPLTTWLENLWGPKAKENSD